MSGRGSRGLLLAGLTLVWVGLLVRLRALAESCVPSELIARFTLHVSSVARAVGCYDGVNQPDPVTRGVVLALALMLPLVLVHVALRGLSLASLVAPFVALVRRLVGQAPAPAPRRVFVVGRAVTDTVPRAPLRARVGHTSTWSHRGPPRFV